MRFKLMSEYLEVIHNHWKDTGNPTIDEIQLADDYFTILNNIIFGKFDIGKVFDS